MPKHTKKVAAPLQKQKKKKKTKASPASIKFVAESVPAQIGFHAKLPMHPKMSYDKSGSLHYQFSELIGPLLASTATNFNIEMFRINPGNYLVFPFLSRMALNFEQYRFNRIKFTAVPYLGTGVAGFVGMAHITDVTAITPTSMQDLLNRKTRDRRMLNGVEGPLSITIGPTELKNGGTAEGFRFVTPQVTTAYNEQFAGQLGTAVEGYNGTGEWAQLFVEYDVTLRYPRFVTPGELSPLNCELTLTTGVTKTEPLGSVSEAGYGRGMERLDTYRIATDVQGYSNLLLEYFGTGITDPNPIPTGYGSVEIGEIYANSVSGLMGISRKLMYSTGAEVLDTTISAIQGLHNLISLSTTFTAFTTLNQLFINLGPSPYLSYLTEMAASKDVRVFDAAVHRYWSRPHCKFYGHPPGAIPALFKDSSVFNVDGVSPRKAFDLSKYDYLKNFYARVPAQMERLSVENATKEQSSMILADHYSTFRKQAGRANQKVNSFSSSSVEDGYVM